uniref:Uncharacterized protein n=1 Tax=Trichogramma kaykai TaxID=54128 RepID=A0ABD2XLV9_9HYME
MERNVVQRRWWCVAASRAEQQPTASISRSSSSSHRRCRCCCCALCYTVCAPVCITIYAAVSARAPRLGGARSGSRRGLLIRSPPPDERTVHQPPRTYRCSFIHIHGHMYKIMEKWRRCSIFCLVAQQKFYKIGRLAK